MRNTIVKSIRRTAKTLFPDRPYVEYVTDQRGCRRLSVDCIKSVVQETKGHLYGRHRSRLHNM